jgi:glycosyltransferase involved in cell wall biosynthesis
LKILLSPCFHIFDEYEGGSDPLLAYSVGNFVALKNEGSVVVTGYANIKSKKTYKIVQLNSSKLMDFGIYRSIIFTLKVFLYNLYFFLLSRRNINLFHHVLPFSIENSFNLIAILFNSFKKPFIIGPIVKAIKYDDSKDVRVYRNIIVKRSFWQIENLFFYVEKLIKPILHRLNYITLNRADKIIVTTQYLKDYLIREKNIASKNIVVINLGIDIKKFQHIKFEAKFNGTYRFLVVSYLLKRKGIQDVIKALSIINKNNENWCLDIVGSGPFKKDLELLTMKNKLQNKVNFVGFVENEQVHEYYERSHLFFNMSIDEGYGMNGIEAMAAGLPIIATGVGGYSDMVIEGKNGYLVDVADAHTLAKRIEDLLQDNKKISNMGLCSRKLAEEKFDWSIVISKYQQLYKQVLK